MSDIAVISETIESGESSEAEAMPNGREHRMALDISCIANALAAYSPDLRKQALAAIDAVHWQVEAELVYAASDCSLFDAVSVGGFAITYRAFFDLLSIQIIETNRPPLAHTSGAFVVERPGRLIALRIPGKGQRPTAHSGLLTSTLDASFPNDIQLNRALSASDMLGIGEVAVGKVGILAYAEGAFANAAVSSGNTNHGSTNLGLFAGICVKFLDQLRYCGAATVVCPGAGLATLRSGAPLADGYDTSDRAAATMRPVEYRREDVMIGLRPAAEHLASAQATNGTGWFTKQANIGCNVSGSPHAIVAAIGNGHASGRCHLAV